MRDWPSYWRCPGCKGTGRQTPFGVACTSCAGSGNAMSPIKRGRPYDGAIVDGNGRLVIPSTTETI